MHACNSSFELQEKTWPSPQERTEKLRKGEKETEETTRKVKERKKKKKLGKRKRNKRQRNREFKRKARDPEKGRQRRSDGKHRDLNRAPLGKIKSLNCYFLSWFVVSSEIRMPWKCKSKFSVTALLIFYVWLTVNVVSLNIRDGLRIY